MQRIKTMWGYDRTPMLPPELEHGEHDLHYKDPNKGVAHRAESSFGSDSESGKSSELDEKYPGTFKILSLALLGEGSKGELPETRGEGGRKYEEGVQSNGWLAVKFRRWIGSDEKDLADVDDGRYTAAPSGRARRLRQALSRDRLRNNETEEKDLASPTTTLSVGSGGMKYKSEFSPVDLNAQQQQQHAASNRYTTLNTVEDDPLYQQCRTGLAKTAPIPTQRVPLSTGNPQLWPSARAPKHTTLLRLNPQISWIHRPNPLPYPTTPHSDSGSRAFGRPSPT